MLKEYITLGEVVEFKETLIEQIEEAIGVFNDKTGLRVAAISLGYTQEGEARVNIGLELL